MRKTGMGEGGWTEGKQVHVIERVQNVLRIGGMMDETLLSLSRLRLERRERGRDGRVRNLYMNRMRGVKKKGRGMGMRAKY